jgi:O-antigen ligase
VVTSSIRPAEVPAFMKYTLVLAVICAAGTIWEYRFESNLFYILPDKLLPGIFTVEQVAESAAVDDLGRRLVRGPAEIPLEAVAMMVMAFPIALVGVMHSTRTRQRLLYALASCLLLAAMASTARKSAFMAPAAVVLALAYFRRRELLRLAPLALVLVIAIHAVSPGAIGSIAAQLQGNRLDVNTVNDRTSDYDAIRPDVWSHLAFGRGYGTYEHTSYRILDMEILDQLVEVGVVGMLAFVLMVGAVVGVARAPIRERSPVRSPIALAVAAAAIAFLVVSTLFDSMSFPHCPYIFLWLAGLLTVAVRREDAGSRPWRA